MIHIENFTVSSTDGPVIHMSDGTKITEPMLAHLLDEDTDILDGLTIHQWKARWEVVKRHAQEKEEKDPAALIQAAWDAAHEVPDGATIPIGTECISRWPNGTYGTLKASATTPSEIAHSAYQLRTLEPLPEPDPEPAWVNADYVWADYDGDREIFVHVAPCGGESPHWFNAAMDGRFTREDMATRNPVPVKGENE